MKIEPAKTEDIGWISEIFEQEKHILGGNGAWIFKRWQMSKNEREKWVVIRPLAFCHYLERLDGFKTVMNIAVKKEAKGKGLGKLLMNYVGRPVKLKTNSDSIESNSFYKSLGLLLMVKKKNKKGRVFNYYQG